MNNRVVGDLVFDKARGIWHPPGECKFDYSDGKSSEAYLRKVLKSSDDLSSLSFELERQAIDWPSEYHLSRKRANLLRGFKFDRRQRVLEVGCGCGAITRFLGETFDDVVSIEGSRERATIARMRTRDLPNVSIINAPFQNVQFKEKFDLIFCIGVFEYSRIFVEADDPYDYILRYFSDLLTDEGMLVLAIENQFGLKYFCSSTEDHSAIMFDGIEGYHRSSRRTRTFGYYELKACINKYFPTCDFYFPYPDYKIPSCVISEGFLEQLDASEFLAEFTSRDYSVDTKPLFDEGMALSELAWNKMVHFFANSFLVTAGKGKNTLGRDWLGMLYSSSRRSEFQTCTKIIEQGGQVIVDKRLISGQSSASIGRQALSVGCQPWVEGRSLQMELARRLKTGKIGLAELLAPTLPWFEKLKSLSTEEDGVRWLDGEYIDAIWRNVKITRDGITFIDPEWTWSNRIRLSYLVMRSIYYFFWDISFREGRGNDIGYKTTAKLIWDACRFYELPISNDDIKYFLDVDTEFRVTALDEFDKSNLRRWKLQWWLMSKPTQVHPGRMLRGKLKSAKQLAKRILKPIRKR